MTTTPDTIEADPDVPIIRIARDFQATPAQLMRAHLDPELYARWNGPAGFTVELPQWDARTGGSWHMVHRRGDEEYAALDALLAAGTV